MKHKEKKRWKRNKETENRVENLTNIQLKLQEKKGSIERRYNLRNIR